jgi:subtilisin family serine protease
LRRRPVKPMLFVVDSDLNQPVIRRSRTDSSELPWQYAPSVAAGPLGCVPTGLTILTGVSILLAEYVGQAGLWVWDQVTMLSHDPLPGSTWLIGSIGIALACALAAALLSLSDDSRIRRVALTWLLAAAFAIPMALTRLPTITSSQGHALLQILVAAVGLVALNRFYGPAGESQIAWMPVALISFATLLPWLWLGALGSLLDTLLDVVLGLLVGAVAARIIDTGLYASATSGAAPGRLLAFWGGAVSLAIIAGCAGWRGTNIALVTAVPATAIAITALYLPRRRDLVRDSRRTAATMVGIAIAGPLALVDPAEMVVVLGFSEAVWPALAAFVAALLATAAGLALVARPSLAEASWGGRVAANLSASVLLLAIYFTFGHPGIYGDALFVVMKDQADVSDARQITVRPQRVGSVYSRLTDLAASSQSPTVAVLRALGVRFQSYYLVNAFEVRAEPALAPLFAAMPGVDRVLPSPHLRPVAQVVPDPSKLRPDAPPNGVGWNVRAIKADRVWSEFGVTGQGIVVGQSDSGVDGTHEALVSSYRGARSGDAYNWLDPWSGTSSPRDLGGHGTHTLATAVGQNGIGIAPGATWFACVNLERNLANPALYLDCMQFMLAPYPPGGDPLRDGNPALAAHVLNNSWGCPSIEGCDVLVYGPAVRALTDAGIFVVASAGNDGPRCGSVDSPPAIYADALSVGAVDRGYQVTDFSSRGPVTADGSNRTKPDLVAPGAEVVSAVPGGYAPESGTSMAGPHVVGVVALMWSAQPALIGDIETTRSILSATAKPVAASDSACGVSGRANNETGFGLVDAYAAVESARQLGR